MEHKLNGEWTNLGEQRYHNQTQSIFCMYDIQYNSTSLLSDIGFIQQFDKLQLGLVNSYKKDIMICFFI